MQLHQRLSRGLISSIAARAVAVASQLVTIPLMARAWGVDVYGQYLTMIAVASYINIATLGVHQAAMAEMAIAYARNDRQAHGNALRGLSQSVLAVTLLCVVVQIVLAYALPTKALLHQGTGGGVHYVASNAIFLIGIQYILLANIGVVTNAIAALGHYGEAQAFDTIRTAIDSLCLWSCAIALHFGPDLTALVSVALSTLTLALAWRRFAKTAPEGLRLWGGVDWRAFARLWEPTMGNFAVGTMFQTVMIQAPRLILASVAGGSAVALFSIIWALLGMIRQSFEVVIHSMTVEFAFAFGAGDKTLATDLLALGTTTAAGFTAAACVPAIALGPWIISLATKGQIHAQHLLIGVLWSGLAIYSASICFLAALQSSNQSYRTVWPLFWRSAAFVGLAYAMTRVWGIYGLAASVVLYQGSVAIVLVTGTCRAFGIRIRDIVNEALSLRSIKRMLDMVIKPLLKRWLPNPVRGSA